MVLVVAATAFYSLAFQKVYENDHPAVAASKWINENIPKGTLFVSDNHWDEFVPNLYSYNVWQFPVYEEDNVEKMNTLADKLAISEYLVFYSNRPYSSALVIRTGSHSALSTTRASLTVAWATSLIGYSLITLNCSACRFGTMLSAEPD
ncbi:MAG: hypothetical protein CM1200mP22_11750 [Dehalococcoidia bacterium]|nr:MAG: hypothetical protein CM1200mP22_11750 [Dehalococcoidia bacterium]